MNDFIKKYINCNIVNDINEKSIIDFNLNNDYALWTIIQEELPLEFICSTNKHVYSVQDCKLDVNEEDEKTLIKDAFIIKRTDSYPVQFIFSEQKLDGQLLKEDITKIQIDEFPILYKYDAEYRQTSYLYKLNNAVEITFFYNFDKLERTFNYSFRITFTK